MVYKNVLSMFLLVGLMINFSASIDISNDLMNYVKMLEPMKEVIQQFYGNSEKIMAQCMVDPRIAAAATEWKVLGPQFTSMAQQAFEAFAEIMSEGMAGMDSSQVSSQVDSFMKAMQPMSQSMGSMFNPTQMTSFMDPTKFLKFGKK